MTIRNLLTGQVGYNLLSICDIGRKYLDDGDGEILKNSAKGESK
jgi:hypothetical protein